MKIIRQYEFGSAEQLVFEDASLPTLGEGEVLIKGRYTGVNFADIKQRAGTKEKGTFPFTVGLDIAGIIEESNSTLFQKGDHVIAFPKNGSYAQYVVASDSLTYKIPTEFPFTQAAAMPTVAFLSAILIENIGQVQPKDTIVIHSASGGVGSMLIQMAKQLGVKNILATVGHANKYDYVKQLGADSVCTYESFPEMVLQHTNNKGATVIFDSVAGEITAQSINCLAQYGTLVQFGNSSGKIGSFLTSDVHSSCRSVKGFSLGTTRKANPEMIRPYAEKMIEQFAQGNFQLEIDQIFSLEDAKLAHKYVESRLHKGKVLIDLS